MEELNNKAKGLSRRGFLTAATAGIIGIAAAGATGCAPQQTNSADAKPGTTTSTAIPTSWDEEADVIVCGGGGSGLTAAYAAIEAGSTVIVLEKGSACGGTTGMAEGAVQAAGTPWQKELSDFTNDDADKLFNFWMINGEGQVEEDLVRVMADNAADNLQWMADSFNITFSKVFGALPTPYIPEEYLADRIHIITDADDESKTGGVVWTTNAEAAITAADGQIITNTTVSSLIVDGENGVIGVTTEEGKSFKATRGVVLAMAGIEHNEELARKYNPQHYWDLKTQAVATVPTDTGDEITMGMEIGADIGRFGGCVDLILATWSGTNNSNPEMPALFVNMRGNRFVREDTTYAFHMRSCYNEALQEGGWDGCTWMILDERMTKMDAQSPWSDNIEGGASQREADISEGVLIEAASIEDLAKATGIPVENLSFTIKKWNDDCAAGVDTLFGRTKQIVPLDTAPYYAYKIQHTNIGAIGGLRINTEAAVLNTHGDVIPHLFAAGSNCAGWIGPYYPGSGTCLQGALNWGRVAGTSASQA